jgi:hypothetical protein
VFFHFPFALELLPMLLAKAKVPRQKEKVGLSIMLYLPSWTQAPLKLVGRNIARMVNTPIIRKAPIHRIILQQSRQPVIRLLIVSGQQQHGLRKTRVQVAVLF